MEARADGIARAILERLHGMEREAPVRDVEYLEALSAAVQQGVRYGIAVLAVGEERAGEVPLPLIVQARYAARHRIPLETALRRYLAAEKQLADAVMEEAAGIDPCQLRAAAGAQSAAFERLLAIATEEYEREARSRPASHEGRQVERARRLLAGELVDPSILEYDLAAHHLGLLAPAAARPLLRRLAAELDCRSLLLTRSPEELWAWLGSTRAAVDPPAVRIWLSSEGDPEQPIGIGEPKLGPEGWRLTHEQARAAHWVAREKKAPVVEYPDAALQASNGRDPVLTASLQERYLLPLAGERDGGQMLRATLRCYFRAGRNSSSAAAELGVSRQTIANRLQGVERCLGQPLDRCADALQAALSLEELGRISVPRDSLT